MGYKLVLIRRMKADPSAKLVILGRTPYHHAYAILLASCRCENKLKELFGWKFENFIMLP